MELRLWGVSDTNDPTVSDEDRLLQTPTRD